VESVVKMVHNQTYKVLILNPFKEEHCEKWIFILMMIKNCAQNLIKTVMFDN
jgi:hypothetical protein